LGYANVVKALLDTMPRPYVVAAIRDAPLVACRRGYLSVIDVFLDKWPAIGSSLWFQTIFKEAVAGEHQFVVTRLLDFVTRECPNPEKVLEECRASLGDLATNHALITSGVIVQKHRLLRKLKWTAGKEARAATYV
jgi:hypothetical protein